MSKEKTLISIIKNPLDLSSSFNDILKGLKRGSSSSCNSEASFWSRFFGYEYDEDDEYSLYDDAAYAAYWDRVSSSDSLNDEDDCSAFDEYYRDYYSGDGDGDLPLYPSDEDDNDKESKAYGYGKKKNSRTPRRHGKRGSRGKRGSAQDIEDEIDSFTLDNITYNDDGKVDNGDIDCLISSHRDIYFYNNVRESLNAKHFSSFKSFYNYLIGIGKDLTDSETAKILRYPTVHCAYVKEDGINKLKVESNYGTLYWEVLGDEYETDYEYVSDGAILDNNK